MIIIIVNNNIACDIVRNMMCYTDQHRKSDIIITIRSSYRFLNIQHSFATSSFVSYFHLCKNRKCFPVRRNGLVYSKCYYYFLNLKVELIVDKILSLIFLYHFIFFRCE